MTVLFAVNGSEAVPAPERGLAELGFWERNHLQEWVIAHPQVLGDDVMVVTAEYDRWSSADGVRTRDRLDVLALEASGRLVVVEIKRADSGSDVHLQAITYAALVSRFTTETLAEAHQHYRAHRGEQLTTTQAADRLTEHAGDLDPDLLRRPRIVLIAGSFPKQVTHTSVWLSEQGIDVSLVSVTAWQVGEQTLAGFSKVYPTPEVEEFTLAPVRAERDEVARKAAERTRTATTVRRLIDNAALADGTLLRFVAQGIDAAEKEQLDAWFAEQPSRATARWRNDTSQPLVWDADRTTWTPTALARHIVAEATGTASGSLRGPSWWRTDEGDDLTSLADVTGGRRRDWSDLHAILAAITPGHWTSYGDLAEVIGTAAQPVGNHVTSCDQCENAYRVLSASGEVSKGFRWSNPAREGQDPARVLAGEGVAFTGNSASSRQRLTPEQLRALVTH